MYKFHEFVASAEEFGQKIRDEVKDDPPGYSVRLSYDADVQWGEVLHVFDVCTAAGGLECGLIPLRGEKPRR
jgi:biopolymer transport protein ExbD